MRGHVNDGNIRSYCWAGTVIAFCGRHVQCGFEAGQT